MVAQLDFDQSESLGLSPLRLSAPQPPAASSCSGALSDDSAGLLCGYVVRHQPVTGESDGGPEFAKDQNGTYADLFAFRVVYRNRTSRSMPSSPELVESPARCGTEAHELQRWGHPCFGVFCLAAVGQPRSLALGSPRGLVERICPALKVPETCARQSVLRKPVSRQRLAIEPGWRCACKSLHVSVAEAPPSSRAGGTTTAAAARRGWKR